MSVDRFREGLLSLNTRQFGNATEIIIQILHSYKESKTLEYDLVDNTNLKIEVKASKVLKKNSYDMTIENFYSLIMNSSNRDRLIRKKDINKYDFDCNIQQIKILIFDRLIYLLFFYDIIEIFEISSKEIKDDKEIFFSNKQHRGNKNEGQFHKNNKTYPHHKKKYFKKSITYNDLVVKLKKKTSNKNE